MSANFNSFVTRDAAGGGKADGVAVTGVNTYRSAPMQIARGKPVSLHMEWTETVASLTGTWTLWYSNKLSPSTSSDTGWVQDTGFPAPAVSGSGAAVITISDMTALHVRLKYVNATGSGTINCYVALPRE